MSAGWARGIGLSDAAGNKMATGQPRIDPKNNAELIVPVMQSLSPGVYTAKWHVVSADSHETQARSLSRSSPEAWARSMRSLVSG
jgi:methionine-rich copper-binding protein CopC